MSVMGARRQSWQARLDELVQLARAEISGERGQEIRQRLESVRDQVEDALQGEQAQRIRREAVELGKEARQKLDRAVSSDPAQDLLGRLDSTMSELGERLRRKTGGEEEDDREPPAAEDQS